MIPPTSYHQQLKTCISIAVPYKERKKTNQSDEMIAFLISQKIPIYKSPAQLISIRHGTMHLHKQINQRERERNQPRAPWDLRHPGRINCRGGSTSYQFQHRRFSEKKKNNVHFKKKKLWRYKYKEKWKSYVFLSAFHPENRREEGRERWGKMERKKREKRKRRESWRSIGKLPMIFVFWGLINISSCPRCSLPVLSIYFVSRFFNYIYYGSNSPNNYYFHFILVNSSL